MRIDKKKDEKRTYQTGFIESEGEFWSFMVEIGGEGGGSSSHDEWLKFYLI